MGLLPGKGFSWEPRWKGQGLRIYKLLFISSSRPPVKQKALFFDVLLIESLYRNQKRNLEDESMDGFPSLVPSRRRFSCRTALLFGIALSILGLGIGCGDFTLYGDDNPSVCDPDPCASTDNAKAGTCTADGGSGYECDCDAGYFWEADGNTCEDPCASDPCDTLDNAVDSSCEGIGVDDFTCECDEGYVWNAPTDSCEVDPCDQNPCDTIDNAVGGSCTAIDADNFTCDCDTGFTWDAQNQRCEGGVVGTCDDLEDCLSDCTSINDSLCLSSCYGAWTGCDCVLDTAALIAECAGTCLFSCIDPESKACWDCVLDCGFDTQCR
jgi:hypothetical protein